MPQVLFQHFLPIWNKREAGEFVIRKFLVTLILSNEWICLSLGNHSSFTGVRFKQFQHTKLLGKSGLWTLWQPQAGFLALQAQAAAAGSNFLIKGCPCALEDAVSSTPGLDSIEACSTLACEPKRLQRLSNASPTSTLNSEGLLGILALIFSPQKNHSLAGRSDGGRKKWQEGELGQQRTALKYFLSLQNSARSQGQQYST